MNNNVENAEKEPKKITAKKIIGYVASGVIAAVLCIVIVAFVVVFVQIGQGKTPSLFGYRVFYVLTDSMTPEIQPGDVILSKAVTEKNVRNLKEGDIITYISESGEMKGHPVTHRIVKGIYFDEDLNDYAVLTRGDKAGAKVDAPVRLGAINAVVVKKSAFLTIIYSAISNGGVFALLFVLPLAVLLVCLIVRLVVTLKTPSEQEKGEKDGEEDDNKRIEELKKQAVEEYIKNLREEPSDENRSEGDVNEGNTPSED